jgi:CRISPR-associated endonuclease Csn1
MGERKRILGIDLGIASCGWGVIEAGENEGEIIATGVRCFDAPLVDKSGEPKSAQRRVARGQRRVIRRRRQRMNAVRKLLHQNGLLPDASSNALHDALKRISPKGAHPPITPWTLRAAAHERALSNDELSVVLGHIARHRGFRSNSKSEGNANAADETSKMKKAMEATREGLAKYRSFGDMLANDEKFKDRKRNRDKDYSHTAKRSDLEDEVRTIVTAQRRFGNATATDDLAKTFSETAFTQRPLQDSEKLVGKCLFEPDQLRTARRAPSFELFRFLQRLAHLRISVGRIERPLTQEEIALASNGFGETKKTITFGSLRETLDLDPNARFAGIPKDKESKLDVAARTGGAAYGTKTLKDALGDAPWQSLVKTPEKLDRIAEVLTFREDLDSIRKGLDEIGLDRMIVQCLLDAAAKGDFKDFTRAAHISALACRNIVPGLREGLVYADACARVGYDHAARPSVQLTEIGSPVTRKAFGEAIKQIRTVARAYGPIDLVHIELARDVGKSAEERREIQDGIEKRTAEKERRRGEAAEHLGRAVSDDELLRYELAKEQNFKCIYSGDPIEPKGVAANDTRYQVDHILPWSRFGDDSYINKTLCTAKANQDKRGRTPYEWFDAEKTEPGWMEYVARVEALKEVKGRKKRNYTLKEATEEVENRFKTRNLTDTQWATRLLADELKRMFPAPEGERRVFTRPGAITSKLRRAWGLEGLKKENGERVPDDRHHAVDALVLAATTESLLQLLTKKVQQREKEGRQDDIFHCNQPWPGFRIDVERAVRGENGTSGVFVSRAERHRVRGKAHDATVRQVRGADGKKLVNKTPSEINGEKIVYERKLITDKGFKESDLDKIPIPAPYGNVADPKRLRDEMVESLRAWIGKGKPKDDLPRSPKGDIIRKVRVATDKKAAIELSGGAVDRGDMARVDAFKKSNKKGKVGYYLVPIYPHQVADPQKWPDPPNRAIVAHKEEEEWTPIDSTFEFLFSLSIHDYIEVAKSDGVFIGGYYKGVDRAGAQITVAQHNDLQSQTRGIGSKTLFAFKKFTIDRLGRKFEVSREVRTWRGKACT